MGRHIGLIVLLFFLYGCKDSNSSQTTVIDTHDYLNDFTTFTTGKLVNIIVEIPAGTNQKWEVNKDSGYLEWERNSQDSLRLIKFLSYPANYGLIPQTYSSVSAGGDGDPLDVFLLGPAIERGEVVPGRIIGIIKMLDAGEQDDKLLAVSDNTHFGSVKTLNELKSTYPGVLEVLSTWLLHYKGDDSMIIQSIEDEQSALEVLKSAAAAYHQKDQP